MGVYYVCKTSRCPRNKPRLRVMAATVQQRGHIRCLECNLPMHRERTLSKGSNTKIVGKRFRSPSSSVSKVSRKKAPSRKRLYKRF